MSARFEVGQRVVRSAWDTDEYAHEYTEAVIVECPPEGNQVLINQDGATFFEFVDVLTDLGRWLSEERARHVAAIAEIDARLAELGPKTHTPKEKSQ